MNFLPIRGVAGALLLASFAGCAACGTDDKPCPNPAADAAPPGFASGVPGFWAMPAGSGFSFGNRYWKYLTTPSAAGPMKS